MVRGLDTLAWATEVGACTTALGSSIKSLSICGAGFSLHAVNSIAVVIANPGYKLNFIIVP